MSRNALVNQFRIVFEKPLPLSPFLVARVGKRGWRSKSVRRKKSRGKLCARAPWSDRWVPAKILEMYRCHQLLLCKFVKMSSNTTLQVLFVRGAAVSSRPQFFLTEDIQISKIFLCFFVSESVPDNLSGTRTSNHQTLSDQKKANEEGKPHLALILSQLIGGRPASRGCGDTCSGYCSPFCPRRRSSPARGGRRR